MCATVGNISLYECFKNISYKIVHYMKYDHIEYLKTTVQRKCMHRESSEIQSLWNTHFKFLFLAGQELISSYPKAKTFSKKLDTAPCIKFKLSYVYRQ